MNTAENTEPKAIVIDGPMTTAHGIFWLSAGLGGASMVIFFLLILRLNLGAEENVFATSSSSSSESFNSNLEFVTGDRETVTVFPGLLIAINPLPKITRSPTRYNSSPK